MASSPSKTKPSTPRLSDRAKVVYPSGIVSTGWPEVERQHRRMGIAFDWFQVAVAKLALAKREDGTYASTVGGVVLSIPRQVGKTFMLCGLLFALCMIFPNFTALWTAQQLRTAKETLRSMQGFARRKAVKPFVAYVRVANGEGEVGFINGSRILFGARDYGFGLGMAGIDVLVFDEGQRLGETALDDMLPTQNRAKNPLFFIVGTPPRPTDNGEVFTRKRTEAMSGTADDLLYVEFSADPVATPRDQIDWDQVARANPSFPEHTPKTAILRMWKNLGPDSFWREGYGIWDASGILPPVIRSEKWDPLKIPPAAAPAQGNLAYGVKFSLDGSRYAVSAALASDEGDVHVEAFPPTPMGQGITPLADWLAARWRQASLIVIDGKAGVGDLVNLLRARGVPAKRILVLDAGTAVAANATLVRHVNEATLTHIGQPGLTLSVSLGAKRDIGTSGGWGFTPALPDADVTPVESAAAAVYGATTGKKPMTGQGRTGGSAGRRTSGDGRRRAGV